MIPAFIGICTVLAVLIICTFLDEVVVAVEDRIGFWVFREK